MADAPPTKTSRGAALAQTIGKFAGAWALVSFLVLTSVLYRAQDWTIDAAYRVMAGFPAAAYAADQMIRRSVEVFGWSYLLTLAFATGLAPLGAAARMIARARMRAGHGDLFERPRAWLAAHPKAARALFALPGVLLSLLVIWPRQYEIEHPGEFALSTPALILANLGMFAMVRKGVRALLAPTLDADGVASTMTIAPDEIVFDAVAVTREAKAVIGGVAGLSLAVVALIASRPLVSLFHDRWPFYAMASYIAVAVLTAIAFQKGSRVAIGVDGVHVRGTSRAKFYAYRDIEEARVTGGDLELVRRGRVLVRLQLHGEDAARRDAVLGRITEHIARVKEGRGATAAQLVASASKETLARVAHGGADYRMAALTREQLWALVEGPEIEGTARRAAASALASSSDAGERVRMRVAAERCAEPQVRVALEEMARAEIDPGAPLRRAAT